MYRCSLLNESDVDKLKPLNPEGCSWKARREQILRSMRAADSEVYVVYKGDIIVGELTVDFRSTWGDSRCIENQRVYLCAFRVLENMRNKHYGTTLLNYVLNELYSRGFSEVTIGVEYDNACAQHIYDTFGFAQVIHTYQDYKLLLRE